MQVRQFYPHPALSKDHFIVPVASDLDGVFPQEFILIQSPDMPGVAAQADTGDLALLQVPPLLRRSQSQAMSLRPLPQQWLCPLLGSGYWTSLVVQPPWDLT